MNDYVAFLRDAAHVKPTSRQLEWYRTGFYAFVHFTVNTYTGRQWGLGNEDPAIFNPVDLDCDQWVEAIKAAGMKGMILTAKHHDGFCLWPSQYTEHCVKNSPWKNGKGDVVREAAEACRRGGIKFGVYLSPWDRNSPYYGTPAYNDYYANQLTELLTGYGDLFMGWQDNACGEGPNGKKQIYDFERFNALIRKYQPHAVIFNDHGPDVRWCGNEAGNTRTAEWAVVPNELCYRAEKQTSGALLPGGLTGIYNPDQDLGSLANIQYSEALSFAGAEVDTSMCPDWFYVEGQEARSLDTLFDIYLRTVGNNACLNLNVPPMKNGRINDTYVKRLHELGDKLRDAFQTEIPCTFRKVENHDARPVYEVTLEKKATPRYIVIGENIAEGQRIESFQLRLEPNGTSVFYSGLTVGYKKICKPAFRLTMEKFYIRITSARDEVLLDNVHVYE